MKNDEQIKRFPLKVLLGFLLITEFLFFVGPLKYNIPSTIKLLFFLLIVNVFFYKGYINGVKKYNCSSCEKVEIPYKLLCICIIISLCLIPIRLFSLWHISPLSPIHIISHLINSIKDPSDFYYERQFFAFSYLDYVLIYITPVITYLTISLIVYWWERMTIWWRFLSLWILIWELLLPIGVGVRKGIMDLGLTLFFLYVAKKPYMLFNILKYKRYVSIGVILVVLFLYYFIYSNLSRYGVDEVDSILYDSNIFIIKDSYKDLINPTLLAVICFVETYLCQGYYALGNALCSEFVFSYGFGSSWFGYSLMNMFDINILPYTYIGKLEYIGIDPIINWHSIYTWLASDYTFYGVPLFMYFVGNFLSITWLDTLYCKNIYAPPTFMFFTIMVFYSFANNQVYSFAFIPFHLIFFLWLFTRLKK